MKNGCKSFEKLRASVEDAVVANVLSAIAAEDLAAGLLELIPEWEGECLQRFICLMKSLYESSRDQDLVNLLRLLARATQREYPTFMEWAEKYPIFLHCLLGELCDDFEEILTQEYEASLLREEMASGEDEDPGDAL